ncbi:MAG: hypothetical protein PWP06_432 [Candidatus Marinimicrobia bacterium]|jgi:uncharacterized membrane protein|nr:hypothetical protein [Candidatus Neomarinimicrobiota bacterium]
MKSAHYMNLADWFMEIVLCFFFNIRQYKGMGPVCVPFPVKSAELHWFMHILELLIT